MIVIWTAKFLDNFALYEARCHGQARDGSIHDCGLVIIDVEFCEAMAKVRKLYGMPIHMGSWTRCWDHNEEVGGKDLSYHLNGRAGDLQPAIGGDMILLRQVCKSVFPYTKDYDRHIHCDVRGKRPFRPQMA